jgi:RND family efflux transporter MFP subunit
MAPPPTVKSSRPSKVILRIIIILAVVAGVGWGGKILWRQVSPGLFGNKRQDKIPTAKARAATISEEIVAVGRLRAVFSTELRSEINGRIIKISAKDGDKVKREDEILRLDQQDILTQLTEMQRTIEAAKLKTERARKDYDRLVDLSKRGVVTKKDFEESRITLALTQNDTAIFEARAANLSDKLAKTIIRAPHDGTLLLRDLTEGQVVTSAAAQNGGTLLGEVADLSILMVRTNINEIDVARLKMGDVARVRVDSMRTELMAGMIKRISTSANESNVDRTRVFPVDVWIEDVDERLRPGMSATVMFTLARVEDTLALPLSAVFSTAEAVRYVFMKKGERFTAHPVETGIADVRRVQILGGLKADDEVALTRPLEFDGEIPVPPPAAASKPRGKRNSDPFAAPKTPAPPQGKSSDRAAKSGRT